MGLLHSLEGAHGQRFERRPDEVARPHEAVYRRSSSPGERAKRSPRPRRRASGGHSGGHFGGSHLGGGHGGHMNGHHAGRFGGRGFYNNAALNGWWGNGVALNPGYGWGPSWGSDWYGTESLYPTPGAYCRDPDLATLQCQIAFPNTPLEECRSWMAPLCEYR